MNLISRPALLAIGLIISVSSCSLFPERPSSLALHDFGSSEKFTASQSGGSEASAWSTVSVEAPEWLQNENIRYRLLYIDPTRVRFYAQDRWLASPPAMLAQRLSVTNGTHGWRLKIRLLEFEQIFDGPQRARVILAFRASVQPPTGEEIVADKLFNLSLPSPTPDAAGAVTASAKLVDEAVHSLQTWFTELPAQP
ncbi:MAG: PqiC family protein [Methylococcaceae bacterium]|nr:PqiC family protein [Methylococcaceae bacterium]MCI0734095.1 PqiC family protein [Methylococcaceae bacterium]